MQKNHFSQSNIVKNPKPIGILAKINFGTPLKDPIDAEEGIDSYLAALLRNGQIHDSYLIRNLAEPLEAYVSIPRPNSLHTKFSSSWVKKTIKCLEKIFGERPTFELLEPSPQKRYPPWQSAKSFYLYTDMFQELSPVRSPELINPIPLYLLPISYETRDYLSRWVESYQDHDSLWIGCGKLEIAAYKQLVDPDSELSKEGREYCQEIEEATGIPTYFYLMRYYSYRKNEDNRLCPGCKKNGLSKSPLAHLKGHLNFVVQNVVLCPIEVLKKMTVMQRLEATIDHQKNDFFKIFWRLVRLECFDGLKRGCREEKGYFVEELSLR